jgi:hypothetical protein
MTQPTLTRPELTAAILAAIRELSPSGTTSPSKVFNVVRATTGVDPVTWQHALMQLMGENAIHLGPGVTLLEGPRHTPSAA